jgi:transcription elongation GreA/GreB family factor
VHSRRKVQAENEALRAELVARDSRIAELESRLARLESISHFPFDEITRNR